MSEFVNILTEERQGILYLTINREDKLNAMNLETLAELRTVFDQVMDNKAIKAVILTGAGEKAFVAGADITEIASLNEVNARKFAESGQEIFAMIENCHKPVIAVTNGYTLGGGCELAMACHMRIATSNAKFGQPEINLGIIPGYGGTQRLTRLVGKGRAMELMMNGENIDANEAYRIGLVNHVCKQDDLTALAEAKMKTITSKSAIALSQIIMATNAADGDPSEGMKIEAECFGKSFASEDMVEGVTAFLEKRKANFK
jgi:enoyl-CoA hydratase